MVNTVWVIVLLILLGVKLYSKAGKRVAAMGEAPEARANEEGEEVYGNEVEEPEWVQERVQPEPPRGGYVGVQGATEKEVRAAEPAESLEERENGIDLRQAVIYQAILDNEYVDGIRSKSINQ